MTKNWTKSKMERTVPESISCRCMRQTTQNTDPPADEISVLSYNILADCHVPLWDYSYTNADPATLQLDFRHRLLVTELKHLDADIVCLQEVGPDYYTQTLLPVVCQMGYEGVFMRKHHDFPVFDEGCALFYKSSRFQLLDSLHKYLGPYAQQHITQSGITLTDKLKQRFLGENSNLVQLCRLQNKVTGQTFFVGNTHLVWISPEYSDLRALQSCCLKSILQEYTEGKADPVILCGDFNSNHEEPSYHITLGGRAQHVEETLRASCGAREEEFEVLKQILQTIKSSQTMKSAYSEVLGHEPYATSFDDRGQHLLDYIFYSPSSASSGVRPTAVLDVPPRETWAHSVPPNTTFPSDHLPLLVKFHFSPVTS